ncbi:hypothetical protein AGABI1DRAFT_72727 [Agaricus bisporus var. burnettii JB137-S8]|uniref:Spindle pole body component n=1 Tax=Agaricus bisporus var. burnettii (strain JB137-S8 / ATCC MYA-4627 / FGSC 10392) TaxID=597362 RepID=K5VZN0_AGABU|nr:uncharacterized protein AGABI1DRAFT_72727 [Agaricus bisporus var. burnettii JB137-S8]EKM79979.1 hypothetical protein AGABI1DRAFT_72727 [Agaricus bisporus var. burnettii JB137-S8]
MSTPLQSRPTSRSSFSRPSSSLSQPSRPPSSSSLHPRSRAASNRPGSAASARPQSRFSQRTQSRLAKSRANPFASVLVTQLTSLTDENDADAFKRVVDHVVKTVESTTLNKGAASVDMTQVEKQINGHALKARITMKDVVSEALLLAFMQLKTHVGEREKDLDDDIQTTHIPDHLQLLLSLSQPPTSSTVTNAEIFLDKIKNPRSSTPSLTWKDILADEPFEGDHWEGILDPTTTPDDHDWDNSSTPSLSPMDSEPEDMEPLSSLEEGDEIEFVEESSMPGSNIPPHTYTHREEFEELQGMQYWRTEWKGFAQSNNRFDIGDPSTLGPALTEVLAKEHGSVAATRALIHERYIREEDMVREVYMALQGRRNIVLEWKNNVYATTSETPRLAHFSQTAQEAILSSLARTATTLEHLRHFRSSVFALSYSRTRTFANSTRTNASLSKNITRTVEAFADAIDIEIRSFDMWCADQEAAICNIYTSKQQLKKSNDVVVSLLHMSKTLSDTFEHTFPVLFNILNEVFAPCLSSSSEFCISYLTSGSRAPAMVSSKLLDILFTSVQVHFERGETVTSGRLMRMFVRTAEPVWEMCGRWLRVGMGLALMGGERNVGMDELDEEFFIEAKIVRFGGGEPLMGLLHPEFWQEGYGLREGVVVSLDDDEDEGNEGSLVNKQQRQKAVPTFLEHVAGIILQTGKAVGLIRALGSNTDIFDTSAWKSFEELVVARNVKGDEGDMKESSGHLFSVSVDTLSRLIYDRLLPRCQEVGYALTTFLVDECGLWEHLEAIENLFFMRRGDAMSHFIDVVFNKMDNKQSWCDFHFLNTAFADVVEAGAKDWIQPSLVRFSYRGGKEKERSIHRTVKSIDGLSMEYAVPFPLTYMLRPSVVAVYNEVFVFLLQIRRAKSVLERILVRGNERKYVGSFGMKVLYVMRSRLSWFINTLLNFLTTFVIHAQVNQFHAKLKDIHSFDEMIELHDNQQVSQIISKYHGPANFLNDSLNKIQDRCLLQKDTSTLHKAVVSILDMSLRFSEFFTSLTGDAATHDISRHSLIKRHRSRRTARKRRDIIGFTQPSREDGLSSSDDDNDDGVNNNFGDMDDEIKEPDILKNLTMETESFSIVSTTGSPEEIAEELNKFSSELDELVRFVRRGVESLVDGSSEAASAFGVLAFALEDWDS